MPDGVGYGISGLGSLAGGYMGASAAERGAKMQAQAANDANRLQGRMFDQQRADLEPWRQAGISALYGQGGLLRRKDGGSGAVMADQSAAKAKFIADQMANARKSIEAQIASIPAAARMNGMEEKIRASLNEKDMLAQAEKQWELSPQSQGQLDINQYEIDPELTRSFTNADFEKDPGYEFRMAEGQKALERSAAARGGLNSGAFGKALSRYGQDFASNEYQNAYNRFNNDRSNRFNRLSALAGVGQTANAQLGQAGQNYATQVGNNNMGAANANAAAGIAGANAWGNAISGVANAGMGYAANQQANNWMNMWANNQGRGK